MSQDYTLKYPVTVDGITTETVTVRRPKVGDHRAVDRIKSDLEKELTMLGRLTNMSKAGIDELDELDYNAITKIVADNRPKDDTPGNDGAAS